MFGCPNSSFRDKCKWFLEPNRADLLCSQEPEGSVCVCARVLPALATRGRSPGRLVAEQLFPEPPLLPEPQDLVQNHQFCFLFEVAEQDQLSEGQQSRRCA